MAMKGGGSYRAWHVQLKYQAVSMTETQEQDVRPVPSEPTRFRRSRKQEDGSLTRSGLWVAELSGFSLQLE
ncbi:hypothetical protein H920_19701 [Fukomys damarensis]|uniref:Uncharacterized protein n=1 Tax=Fukomys damarensis TaxID=885580 RepID=A0A091CP06_FUKDA|nr:hypothetical protein H920_19701 [Fukomys damarensis]